jgi:hypothetical protein
LEKKAILSEIENILEQLSIKLKYGRGYFNGGLYRYKEESVIYLNRMHSVEKHIDILCKELKNYDLEGININPEVWMYIKNPDDN